MIYEIISASKSDLPTEGAVRAALAKEKPGLTVENITTEGNEWVIRLADGKPPWLDKEDDSADSADSADSSDSADDADSESDSDSADDEDSSDKSDKGKSKDKKGDPVAEVKNVINQLTTLFQDLGGKVDELQAAHDDKEQKLKDISDTVGDAADGGPGGLPSGLEGDGSPVGPVPGGPPGPPMPAKGLDRRKPGLPGAPGGGLPAFTHKYEVATHPGVDSEGKRISLTAAATALEADPDFVEYEVVGMTENADGTYSAKLKLRSE